MSNVVCFSRSPRPRPFSVTSSHSYGVLWATEQFNRHIYFPAFVRDLDAQDFFNPALAPKIREEDCETAIQFLSSVLDDTALWEAL